MVSLVLPVIQAKALLAFTSNFIGRESFPVQNTRGINLIPYNRMADESGSNTFMNEGLFIRNDNKTDNSVKQIYGLITYVKF
jgi:hypothetical protein